MLVRRRMFIVRRAALVRMLCLVCQMVMDVRCSMSHAERRMVVAEVRSQQRCRVQQQDRPKVAS